MHDNLQNRFTELLAQRNEAVTVFLTNGVKLNGKLTHSDFEALTLTRDGNTQLVFKHAVATVMPNNAFDINEIFNME